MMLLALAGKCGFFGASGSSAGSGRGEQAFVEQRRQAQRADADAAIAEELAAGAVFQEFFVEIHGRLLGRRHLLR